MTLPTVQLARDTPPDVLRARERSNEWERIARGVYLPGDRGPTPHRRRDVALGRLVGIHDRLTTEHWFSHESAAMLWGLPLWMTPARVHLMQRHTAGSGRDPGVAHHPLVPPSDQRGSAAGLPVTSLERTVVDCASTLPPLQGLVVADAAVRAGADRETIERILSARGGQRGVVRARAVIALADDGAESPGESAARFVVVRDGFPVPRTQVPVATRLGTFWSDMGWEEWRLVLEYDGRPKYDDRATEAFIQEKRRHDAILEAGWRAIRATKEDLSGTTLVRRLRPLIPAHLAATLRPRRDLRG
ncbi:hypothetical protein [uncultured Cellulomonas sp.]|uniref:hypothetical protein n=1 Tax=uncultured Cellulomonas sp. TaxID=189682 RepID=UPI0028F16C10|nr:hypothetical protein [uncultured Cellulomonas sp.]